MGQVIELYGKVWQTWDTTRHPQIPLGDPVLMTSFTQEGQLKDFEKVVGERDKKLGTDWKRKKEIRKGLEDFKPHDGADGAWKRS